MTTAVGLRVVVTGGGTAGHVLPALAVADALVAAGVDHDAVLFVGTERGQDRALVTPTGYRAAYLDVVGVQRSLSRRNLAVVPRLRAALRAARRLVDEFAPDVVVNLGGYGSFPATWAARRRGIPIVVVSYDRRPGVVSKLFAKRAALVGVAFPGSPLPGAVLTGAPVRQQILAVDRERAAEYRRRLPGGPIAAERFLIVVAGGSLGSKLLNDAVGAMLDRWAQRDDLAIVHIVGQRHVDQAAAERDGSSGILYRVIGFTDEMPALYGAADLLVTRGGASTLVELAVTGSPAIVVPWAGAAENHQLDNARVLTDAGAAVLVEEDQLGAGRLADEIDSLVKDRQRLRSIAAAAHAAGQTHRSGRLVEAILAVTGS